MPLFKYNHVADLWPLNPKGELIYGVKIEDTYADQQVEGTLALPGLSMAEWGPGDHSYWLYGLDVMPEDAGQRAPNIVDMPEMVKVRQKVLDLCKQHNVRFLNAANTNKDSSDYIIKQLTDGGNDYVYPMYLPGSKIFFTTNLNVENEQSSLTYSPDAKQFKDEYERAELILDAYEHATTVRGRGAVMLGDEMIDEASRKMALVISGKGRAAGMSRTSTFTPPDKG